MKKRTLKQNIKVFLYYLGVYSISMRFYGFVLGVFRDAHGVKNQRRKRKYIRRLQNELKYGVFIETGTYRGDMIENVRSLFDSIYSIELGEDLYRAALKRFSPYKHITLYHGDSVMILPKIVKLLTQPAMFWLDAHFSGGVTARGETDTALNQELDTVLSHHIKHTILIDDAHFLGNEGYPTFREIQKRAIQSGYNASIIKYCDIVLLRGTTP